MRNLLDFLIKYNYWFLFVILEVISFALLFRFNNYQGSVFFTSSNVIVGSVYNLTNNITGYFHLKTINEELVHDNVMLRIQLEQLQEKMEVLSQDGNAIEKLQKESLEEYDIFKAKVINNSLTYSDNYITINKGERDGIRKEMGVIDGQGVVGIVYLTSSNYSVIIPILNSKSNISCKIKQSEYFGILNWDGGASNFAIVKDMPRHSMFALGDTIVTSGQSTVFPPGIPIGTVEDMKDSHDGLSYVLKVKLFTDFARLQDVCIISRKGKEEQLQLEAKLKEKE